MTSRTLEATIRERVAALFRSRGGLSQKEFADAIGVDPSWVSQFFAAKRNANDIHLLARIARYFSVSVGYLLGESDRNLDPGAATLLATWEGLTNENDRRLFLDVAATFRGRSNGSTGEPPTDDAGGSAWRKRSRDGGPQKRKH